MKCAQPWAGRQIPIVLSSSSIWDALWFTFLLLMVLSPPITLCWVSSNCVFSWHVFSKILVSFSFHSLCQWKFSILASFPTGLYEEKGPLYFEISVFNWNSHQKRSSSVSKGGVPKFKFESPPPIGYKDNRI